MYIKLVDGTTTIELMEESVPESHLVVECADKQMFLDIWDDLTPENVQEFVVYIDDVAYENIAGAKLTGCQVYLMEDEMVAHFYLVGGIPYIYSDDERPTE